MRVSLAWMVLCALGCSSSSEPISDAGTPPVDAGSQGDSGTPPPDAGQTPDAGQRDAGGTPVDAGCSGPSGCPTPATDCQSATCTTGACGISNVAMGVTCVSSGGRVCDGSGQCVACVSASNCPAQTTLCVLNTCTSGACGTAPASLGVACNDSAGIVCDGAGHCVSSHCTDGVQDADETDVDCGGSCGATCKDTAPQQKCKQAGDCISHVCSGTPLLCQPPSCSDGVQNGNETDVDCGGSCSKCATGGRCRINGDCQTNDCQNTTCVLEPLGLPCVSNSQCQFNFCVSGVCCNSACAGACQACATVLTGAPNGSCSNVFAGQPAQNGGCAAAPPCGNTGACASGGACQLSGSGVVCLAGTCSGSTQTAASTCDGSGTCTPGTVSTCPGNLVCGATTCLMACGANSSTGDANCDTGFWCDGMGAGACQAALPPAAPCTRNAQCASGMCQGSTCQ